ncbi:MAG: AraC family transcriptional regulator [Treponema sp.]|nr:AraC family transcriptional regulator [Treponema sp.]
MDYIGILQEMLRYIDENIKKKLSVKKLAARAGFSPYHFCRIFQWNIGYSIMEYVRLRRLAFAASELKSGKWIIDIAVEYGYETHTGFLKAFKRRFGSTPEKYRLHASYDLPRLPVIEKSKQYVNGGIVMEPKMIKKTAVKLAGFAIKVIAKDKESTDAFTNLWQEYSTDGRQKKLHGESFVKSHAEYGACFPENPENGEFEYVVGVEVKDETRIVPKDYFFYTIPESLYAVFTPPPSNKEELSLSIKGTYNYIFSEWFPNSGYEFMENGVDFVLYDEHYQTETGKFSEIYIPVVKRQPE